MNKLFAHRVYLLLSCVNALVNGMVFTVFAVYQITVIHLSPLQLVLAGTIYEVTCFFFQIPTGMVADLYSRKSSILIGLVLSGVSYVLLSLFPVYMAVIAAQVLMGIGSTFIDGALEAWVADEAVIDDIGTVFIRGAKYGQIGAAVGIIIGTALGNCMLSLPIGLGGGMLILLTGLLARIMPEAHFTSAAPEELKTIDRALYTFKAGVNAVRRDRSLWLLMLIALFAGLASEGYDRLSMAHFLQDTTLPTLWNLQPVTWFGAFGILGMILSASVIQVSEVMRKRGRYAGAGGVTLVNLLYTICMLLFGLATRFPMMLSAYLALMTLRVINRPMMSALLTKRIAGSLRATVLSTNSQINSFGEIFGGPVIGVIADRFSPGVGISSTVVFLIPLVIILLMVDRTAPEQGRLPRRCA